ncbi:hypothetical protein FHX69_4345 [Prauserella muralis]|nr:hypothetical protein FHX69_4345 [Prauserella muralis]
MGSRMGRGRHYPAVRVSHTGRNPYRRDVSIATEPESMDQLIADCADIPRPEVRQPRPSEAAQPWTVDDVCHAQVAELDEYV